MLYNAPSRPKALGDGKHSELVSLGNCLRRCAAQGPRHSPACEGGRFQLACSGFTASRFERASMCTSRCPSRAASRNHFHPRGDTAPRDWVASQSRDPDHELPSTCIRHAAIPHASFSAGFARSRSELPGHRRRWPQHTRSAGKAACCLRQPVPRPLRPTWTQFTTRPSALIGAAQIEGSTASSWCFIRSTPAPSPGVTRRQGFSASGRAQRLMFGGESSKCAT